MAGPYHLYIANKNYSSWSLRPWILLRHHNIAFEEHLMPFLGGNAGRQPQWKAFSPTATVPCLHHFAASSSPPVVLWESFAIIDYLADLHPDICIWPRVEGDRGLEKRAWARSAAAEMHSGFPAIRHEMAMNVGLRIEFSVSPAATAQLARINQVWTEGITRFGGPFLAGKEFGAVDAMFAPVVLRLQTFAGSMELLSEESKNWVEMMLELHDMKAWIEDALKEPWREEGHEEDTVLGRRVEKDLRASTTVEGVDY